MIAASATRISAKGDVLCGRCFSPRGHGKRCLALNVRPRLLGAGLAASDEVEDRSAEVSQPLFADALATQEGGGR